MNTWFLRGDYASQPIDPWFTFLALMISFLGGQLMAWIYMWTHSGLSYSRAFVKSLVLLPVLVSVVMLIMANNMVTAFGLMACFAIVRFRTILRDTLDTTYILSSIVVGMAAGTQKFTTAIISALVLAFLLLYLWYTNFGTRQRYDVILNLHWSRPLAELPGLQRLLTRHSRRTQCASQRLAEGYEGIDLSYRLLLRNTERIDDLVTELRSFSGVSRITSLKAEDESEL